MPLPRPARATPETPPGPAARGSAGWALRCPASVITQGLDLRSGHLLYPSVRRRALSACVTSSGAAGSLPGSGHSRSRSGSASRRGVTARPSPRNAPPRTSPGRMPGLLPFQNGCLPVICRHSPAGAAAPARRRTRRSRPACCRPGRRTPRRIRRRCRPGSRSDGPRRRARRARRCRLRNQLAQLAELPGQRQQLDGLTRDLVGPPQRYQPRRRLGDERGQALQMGGAG
jgi:hypothetical protein